MDTRVYRENVCILLFNSSHELFLGERIYEAGVWQLPQGGVESIWTLEENVTREVEEETGIPGKYLKVVKRLQSTHQYDFPHSYQGSLSRYRGQNQSFWLVEFQGSNALINITKHHPEFRAWMWCHHSRILEKVDPVRRPGYEAPLREASEFFSLLPVPHS
jgi:putative (di)nucleoside polyphosphate hydrolase